MTALFLAGCAFILATLALAGVIVGVCIIISGDGM